MGRPENYEGPIDVGGVQTRRPTKSSRYHQKAIIECRDTIAYLIRLGNEES